jgi:hypothetical protein
MFSRFLKSAAIVSVLTAVLIVAYLKESDSPIDNQQRALAAAESARAEADSWHLGMMERIREWLGRPKRPSVVSVPAFGSITNIVFIQKTSSDSNAWLRLSVSDSNQLRRIVAFTQITRKQPCACDHVHEALFQGPPRGMRVSFCDHCFNLAGGTFAGYYMMPASFYAEFRNLVRQHSNDNWRVLPP